MKRATFRSRHTRLLVKITRGWLTVTETVTGVEGSSATTTRASKEQQRATGPVDWETAIEPAPEAAAWRTGGVG